MPFDHKQEYLDSIAPGRIKILRKLDSGLFEINDLGTVRETTWKALRRSVSSTPDPLSGYKSQVDPSKFEILGLVPHKPRNKVRIRDIQRDVVFEVYWNSFIARIRHDPDSIFGADSVERRQKIISTNLSRFGHDNASSSPVVRNKISKSLTKHYVDGMDLRGLSDKYDISYTYVVQLHRRLGQGLSKFLEENPISKDGSSIEFIIREQVLDSIGIKYAQQPSICGIRPDFLVPSHNLVIECDGLYWHSEANGHGKNSHLSRRQLLESNGYRVLAFREDEILDHVKLPIINSIISNALGLSNRLFARKLEFVDVPPSFFDNNHLMGCGARKTGLGLADNNGCVIGMTFKKGSNNSYEIDRLCTRLGHVVVGGFSRILTRFIQIHNLGRISTFVDRRYGIGTGLLKTGFKLVHEHPSFRWTNFRDTQHRLKFRSSNAPTGWCKIWDYGQAKFNLEII